MRQVLEILPDEVSPARAAIGVAEDLAEGREIDDSSADAMCDLEVHRTVGHDDADVQGARQWRLPQPL